MSDFVLGTPEVSEVPVEQAVHASPEERFGDLSQAMTEAGVDVQGLFGAAEPNIPASIAQGDWGQADRGFDSMVPQPPPVPGHVEPPTVAPRRRDVAPPPATTPHGFVDPATSSPYDDLNPPAPTPQQPQRQGMDMSPEEYLAMTGNTPPPPGQHVPFGQQQTPQQLTDQTQMGHLKNEVGELKAMLAQVLQGQTAGGDPEQQFAAEVGLSDYEDDHMLTAAELRSVLARTAGSLYNEARNMVATAAPSPTPQVDPRVEAVKAHMVARHPWLENLEGQAQDTAIAGLLGQGGGTPPAAPSGTQSVQHHPGGQRPATFVERGSSINQQGVPTPTRRMTAADMVAAKKARGEYVSTEELGMALREQGVNIPTKR